MIKPPRKPRASQPAKPGRKPQAPMPPLPGVKPQAPMPPLPGQKPSAPMPPMPGQKPVSYTSDITMESTLKQFYRDSLGALVDSGRAAPSTLTTTPTDDSFLDGITDAAEGIGMIFENIANSQFAKRLGIYGGSGMDSKDARVPVDGQTPPQETTYRERQRDFIADGNENMKLTAYSSHGNVKIGYGLNLERDKELFMGTLGIDENEYQEYRNGKKSLDPLDAVKLFNQSAKMSERFIAQTFEGTDLTEPQRLALESLHYNHPSLIGPNLKGFVEAGDWESAVEEILYFSNRSKSKTTARRRLREATMFAVGSGIENSVPSVEEYMKAYDQPRTRGFTPEVIAAIKERNMSFDQNVIVSKIEDYSAKLGVPTSYMIPTANQESKFDPSAISDTGAAGVFQFTKRTWNVLGERNKEIIKELTGKDWRPTTGDENDPRFDPDLNIIMGALLTKENQKIVKSDDPVVLYMAHFVGPSAAKRFARAMESNPQAEALSIFRGKQLKHIKGSRTNMSVWGGGKSIDDVYRWASKKFPKAEESEETPELPEVIHAERGDNYPEPLFG